MAWVTVNGSKGIWEYENTAVVTDTYKESADGASMSISNGIRTFTKPGTSDTVANYMQCRTVSDSVERGELSKAFYDAVFTAGGGIDTIEDSVTDAATTLQVWFDGADSGQFTQVDIINDDVGSWDTDSNLSAIGSDGTEELNVQDGAIYYDTDLNKEYVLYNNTWTEV